MRAEYEKAVDLVRGAIARDVLPWYVHSFSNHASFQ